MTAKQFDLHKRQALLKEMLVMFDAHCRKFNITYSLAYGTMLGAVREHGFIPWDNDADIMLSRKEYEKLILSLDNNYLSDHKYKIIKYLWTSKIVDATNYWIAWIDIFILDNVPDERLKSKAKLYCLLMLQGMSKDSLSLKGSIAERIMSISTWTMGRLLTNRLKTKLYEDVSKIGNRKASKEISVYDTIYKYMKRDFRYPAELVESVNYMQFEDVEMPVYTNYHSFLKETYGDYMKRPPVEEQVPTHI